MTGRNHENLSEESDGSALRASWTLHGSFRPDSRFLISRRIPFDFYHTIMQNVWGIKSYASYVEVIV